MVAVFESLFCFTAAASATSLVKDIFISVRPPGTIKVK